MNQKQAIEMLAIKMYSECCDFAHRYADRVSFKPRPWLELGEGDKSFWIGQAECASQHVIENLEDFVTSMQPCYA